ncbi:MAG: CDP-alcohol phosphatidyltransferase family protein [Bacteroidales bacterium]
MSSWSEIKRDYHATLKSSDTEEWIDLAFYRPVGYAWALLASKIGVTPNVITIASVFLGVGAGICFYYNDLWINICGMLLLIWANSYDSADGQLARMTRNFSKFGRMLDGFCGDIWFVAIYLGIILRLTNTDTLFMEYKLLAWGLAALAGLFHSRQASFADYYRNIHLYFLKGEQGSELSSYKSICERYDQISFKTDFWESAFLFFYRNYTRNQERTTPKFQLMMVALKERFPDGVVSEKFRNDFRAKSKPMMKYTNILSFNTRVIALFVSLFVGMPYLYFIFEIVVLNAILIYMYLTHERFCAKFTKELNDGLY